jgi:hypothetical protein
MLDNHNASSRVAVTTSKANEARSSLQSRFNPSEIDLRVIKEEEERMKE